MPVCVKESDVLIAIQEATEKTVKFILIAKIDTDVFKDGTEVSPIVIPIKILLDGFRWLLPRSINEEC